MYVSSNLTQSVVSSDLLNEQYNVGEIVALLTDTGLFVTIIVLLLHTLKKNLSFSK